MTERLTDEQLAAMRERCKEDFVQARWTYDFSAAVDACLDEINALKDELLQSNQDQSDFAVIGYFRGAEEQLEMLWRKYVLCDQATLDAQALEFREKLLEITGVGKLRRELTEADTVNMDLTYELKREREGK